DSGPLALITGQMGTACTFHLNGKEITRAGDPGKTREESHPAYRPAYILINSPPEVWDLVVRCSNFHHSLKSGFWSSIELGTASEMGHRREYLVAVDWFGAGSLLIMGLYHIGLFSLRTKDRSALWFGIFCILIAVRSLSIGTFFISRILPLDWF